MLFCLVSVSLQCLVFSHLSACLILSNALCIASLLFLRPIDNIRLCFGIFGLLNPREPLLLFISFHAPYIGFAGRSFLYCCPILNKPFHVISFQNSFNRLLQVSILFTSCLYCHTRLVLVSYIFSPSFSFQLSLSFHRIPTRFLHSHHGHVSYGLLAHALMLS